MHDLRLKPVLVLLSKKKMPKIRININIRIRLLILTYMTGTRLRLARKGYKEGTARILEWVAAISISRGSS